MQSLRAAINSADALLLATPEYNGSIPGQLKNAIDWASRPPGAGVLGGKPVAVVGASPSRYGASWAQTELRKVLDNAGAHVLEHELTLARADTAFTADGYFADSARSQQLRRILADLTATGAGTERAAVAKQ